MSSNNNSASNKNNYQIMFSQHKNNDMKRVDGRDEIQIKNKKLS